MSVREEISKQREEIIHIAAENGIKHIRFFGSVAREQDHDESDIDLLVEFDNDRSLFDLIRFKHILEEKLGRNVDIVTENSIHKEIRDRIVNEAIEL